MHVAKATLINLAESRWQRTACIDHCEEEPAARLSESQIPCDFFSPTSHRTLLTDWCPLLNFLRLLRGRLIGRTPDFESGYRGSSPRPGAKIFQSGPYHFPGANPSQALDYSDDRSLPLRPRRRIHLGVASSARGAEENRICRRSYLLRSPNEQTSPGTS
jgi:hypothetical protein